MKPRRGAFGRILDYIERVMPNVSYWPFGVSHRPPPSRTTRVLRNEEALNKQHLDDFREHERRGRNHDR